MVVGEPILMGGDLGDKDERRITRLENNNGADFPPTLHNHVMPEASMNGGRGSSHSGMSAVHNRVSYLTFVDKKS